MKIIFNDYHLTRNINAKPLSLSQIFNANAIVLNKEEYYEICNRLELSMKTKKIDMDKIIYTGETAKFILSNI